MTDGVRLEINTSDYYVTNQTKVTASRGEHQVSWKLPNRLIERPEIALAACEEIVKELEFYIERIVPIHNRFRNAS